jgi:PBSX family phage portal protein
VPPRALARVLNITSHHRSAIGVKVNLLLKTFIPHPLLKRKDFEGWALDFLTFGNGYMERVDNRLGLPMALRRSLAVGTRVGLKPDQYWFQDGQGQEHAFEPGSVLQIQQADVSQEIYGVPEYISALQSMFLNEAATLFRRRYYKNGSHAGFLFYLSEAYSNEKDVAKLKEALRQSKGVGNFKNLFLHIPGGKKDGVQTMPISEVAAKDEFLGIKNVTRDDVLVAHRVPPQLLGIVPNNAGGFGDVRTAAQIFYLNEIEPLQQRLMELNEWLGIEVLRFGPYDAAGAAPAAA